MVVGLWGAPGGKIPRARLYPYSTPSKGGALGPWVVSPDFAHLRVWEVGWGNVHLDLCGVLVVVAVTVGSRPKRVEPSGQLAEHCVLVRESRANWLAGARWGLSSSLYR
jgi:hypothetical protein